MSATCPKCGVSIKPLAVRPRFACHFCSAELTGRVFGPLIWAIAIWQLTDIFFYPLFQQLSGDTWTAFTFRTLLCTWIGLRLYMLLINECDSVEIADPASPDSHDHASEGAKIANHQREAA